MKTSTMRYYFMFLRLYVDATSYGIQVTSTKCTDLKSPTEKLIMTSLELIGLI